MSTCKKILIPFILFNQIQCCDTYFLKTDHIIKNHFNLPLNHKKHKDFVRTENIHNTWDELLVSYFDKVLSNFKQFYYTSKPNSFFTSEGELILYWPKALSRGNRNLLGLIFDNNTISTFDNNNTLISINHQNSKINQIVFDDTLDINFTNPKFIKVDKHKYFILYLEGKQYGIKYIFRYIFKNQGILLKKESIINEKNLRSSELAEMDSFKKFEVIYNGQKIILKGKNFKPNFEIPQKNEGENIISPEIIEINLLKKLDNIYNTRNMISKGKNFLSYLKILEEQNKKIRFDDKEIYKYCKKFLNQKLKSYLDFNLGLFYNPYYKIRLNNYNDLYIWEDKVFNGYNIFGYIPPNYLNPVNNYILINHFNKGNEKFISVLPLNDYFIVFYEIENTWAKVIGIEDIKIAYAQIYNNAYRKTEDIILTHRKNISANKVVSKFIEENYPEFHGISK